VPMALRELPRAVAPADRRSAWSWAILTHVPLWGVTWTLVELSTALGPTFYAYAMVHFCVALLLARLAGIFATMWELAFGEPPAFVTGGWMSAFDITVIPLFIAAFAAWWVA
jgi:hypothetical protein